MSFAEFTLSALKSRFFASLRMTSEGLRMTAFIRAARACPERSRRVSKRPRCLHSPRTGWPLPYGSLDCARDRRGSDSLVTCHFSLSLCSGAVILRLRARSSGDRASAFKLGAHPGKMNPDAGRCGMLETRRSLHPSALKAARRGPRGRRGNQQATPFGNVPGRGVLRDYEQRGCDAEDIVQPPQECGIGR